MLKSLKARFPKTFAVLPLVLGALAVGGVAAYEKRAQSADSCCYPGSPCCYAGSPCCKGHDHTAQK